jgi:hypothetical protein
MPSSFSDVQKYVEAVFQGSKEVYVVMFAFLANGFACVKEPLTLRTWKRFCQIVM